MNYINIILIVAGVIALGFLWKQGYLLRFSNYIQETREELRKCTWPTWTELKGSTMIVMICIALIGVFTIVVDAAFAYIVTVIS